MRSPSLTVIAGLIALTSPAWAQGCKPFPASHLIEAGKLQMSINPTLPPMQFVNERGELKGLNVDLTEAIARKICLDPLFMRMDSPSMIPGLTAHRFDMINTGLFWTEARAAVFYMVPYGLQSSAVVVAPGSSAKFATPDQMAGMHVGAEVNSYPYVMTVQLAKDLQAKGLKSPVVQGFANTAEAVSALQAGQLDAVVTPNDTAISLQKRGGGKVALSGLYASEITFTFLDKDLAQATADALTALKADGTYDKIFDQFGMTRLDTKTFAIKGPSAQKS